MYKATTRDVMDHKGPQNSTPAFGQQEGSLAPRQGAECSSPYPPPTSRSTKSPILHCYCPGAMTFLGCTGALLLDRSGPSVHPGQCRPLYTTLIRFYTSEQQVTRNSFNKLKLKHKNYRLLYNEEDTIL